MHTHTDTHTLTITNHERNSISDYSEASCHTPENARYFKTRVTDVAKNLSAFYSTAGARKCSQPQWKAAHRAVITHSYTQGSLPRELLGTEVSKPEFTVASSSSQTNLSLTTGWRDLQSVVCTGIQVCTPVLTYALALLGLGDTAPGERIQWQIQRHTHGRYPELNF